MEGLSSLFAKQASGRKRGPVLCCASAVPKISTSLKVPDLQKSEFIVKYK